MFEYQVSISINGAFFFRTDWARKDEIAKVARSLIEKYGIESVRVRKRSLASFIATGHDEIEEMLE